MGKLETGNELNTEILHDLLSTGAPKKYIAQELGVTVSSLNKTIRELQEGQGLLLKYRELQHLQLTNLQAKCLEAMTPGKIENASLTELAQVYRILKDKEVGTNNASDIKGIVGYLIAIEKELAHQNEPVDVTVYATEDEEIDDDDDLPNL